jgi:hypothetical protein
MKTEKQKTTLSNTMDWKAVLEIRQDEIKQSATDWVLRELYSTRKFISKQNHWVMATYIFDVLPDYDKLNV